MSNQENSRQYVFEFNNFTTVELNEKRELQIHITKSINI